MAIDDEDLELDEAKAKGGKKSGSKLVKIILLVTVAVVVIASSIVGTMFATGAFSGKSDDAGHMAEMDAKSTKAAKTDKEVIPGKNNEVFYESLTPPFVVNFQDKNTVRFLQVGIDIMALNQQGIDNAKKHMPVIRNDIVFVLGDVKYQDINSREGKEKLRKQILADVKKILKERTGNESIADLFFTSFVMQ